MLPYDAGDPNVQKKRQIPQEPKQRNPQRPSFTMTLRGGRVGRQTYFHIGALRLQELADHLAQLVGVRELPHGGQLRPGGVLGRWAGVRGVHLMQTAAERGHLFRALRSTV